MLTISTDNLSIGWARAFLALLEPGCEEISPLIVTVCDDAGLGAAEHAGIRNACDEALRLKRQSEISTVANTIFPQSLWNPARGRENLYHRYLHHALPRVRRCPANNRGTYFARMIAYHHEPGKDPVNQLEHILETWARGNHRHSALQVSIFDPRTDHSHSRRLGFPCLHQICFTPLGRAGLAVSAFYATQHIFEKAYGNYLGILRLGKFMAHEMDLTMVRMTCIAGAAKLGNFGKEALEDLGGALRPLAKEVELIAGAGRALAGAQKEV